MKATIAGITYEGTPEEISRMLLLQRAESHYKPNNQPNIANPLQGITGCKNVQCFCDGSCTKPKSLTGLAKSLAILDGLYDKYNT